MIRSLSLAILVSAIAVARAQDAEWKPFTSDKGRFTATFPGKPMEQFQSVKLPGGKSVEVVLYVLELKKGEGSLAVGFTDYPAEVFKTGTDDKRLEHARDGAVLSAKGKLRSEKKITLGSAAGRELLIESETRGNVRTRLFAVKNRLYQAMVVGPKKLVDSKEASKFLDSFQIAK